MAIISINPDIVAFDGDDLINGKLVLGKFMVNAKGLIFLEQVKDVYEYKSPERKSLVDEFFPETPPEDLLPPEGPEREAFLKEYHEARNFSLQDEIKDQANSSEIDEINRHYSHKLHDALKATVAYPKLNYYFVEQTMAYIEQQMNDEKDELTFVELNELYIKLGCALDQNEITNIFVDSPYYGENFTPEEYRKTHFNWTDPEYHEELQNYFASKGDNYYSDKKFPGITLL